jgi:hypothetical protein
MLKRNVELGQPYESGVKWLVGSLYMVALALAVYPALDVLAGVVPVDVGSVRWRFGAAHFIAQSLWSVMAGLVVASLVAWRLEHRGVLLLVVIMCVLVVLGAGVLGLLAALDFVQVRQMVVQAAKPRMDVSGLRLGLQLGMAVLVAVPLGAGSWLFARSLRTKGRGRSKDTLGVVYGVGTQQSSRGA